MPKTKKQNNNNAPKVKNFWFTDWRLKKNYDTVGAKKCAIVDYIGPIWKTSLFQYMQAGYEIGEKSGKHHIQGWFQTKVRVRKLTLLKKLAKFGIDVHGFTIGVCRGDEVQNDKYTSKDGIFHTWGKFVPQGFRKDMALQQALKESRSVWKGDEKRQYDSLPMDSAEAILLFLGANIRRLEANKKILALSKK